MKNIWWFDAVNELVLVGSVLINIYLWFKSKTDKRFELIANHASDANERLLNAVSERKADVAGLDKRVSLIESRLETIPTHDDVLDILMGALTNHPALDGMQPLALRAAATARFIHREESDPMNKLLAALCAALALDASTTEDQAIAALSARLQADPLGKLRAELGVDAKADESTVIAACAALKKTAAQTAPDPAKFIGIEAFNEVRGQLAALSARIDTPCHQLGEIPFRCA